MKAMDMVWAEVMKKPVRALIAKKHSKDGESAVAMEKISPPTVDQNSVGALPMKEDMGTHSRPPTALYQWKIDMISNL